MQSVNFKEPPVTAAPDVLEMSIEPTDEFLIVASDGLWEVSRAFKLQPPKSRQIANGLSPRDSQAQA